MIKILISFHAQTQGLAYGDNREMAEAELARLTEEMGHDKWGRNGKGDKPTHTLKCPTGDVTVVLDKVEVARLVDMDKDNELHQALNNRADEQEIQFRKRLVAEGLSK